MTPCLPVPAEPAAAGRPETARRLVLVLDQSRDRLDRTASFIAAASPSARVLVAEAVGDVGAAAGQPDVVLVRADPEGWAAASVLAAHRQPSPGLTVSAFLVAEGPLEKFSVLITDFPGLRLLPPEASSAAFLAGLAREAVRSNAGAGQQPEARAADGHFE